MQQIVSVVLLSSNFSAPSAGELEEVLKSLAWQSPSLAQYFAHQNMRFRLMAGGNFERENELLSEGDIADLLAGAWRSPFADPQTTTPNWSNTLSNLSWKTNPYIYILYARLKVIRRINLHW